MKTGKLRFAGQLVLAASMLLAVAARADVRDTETHRQLSLGVNGPSVALPREDWVLSVERVRKDRVVTYYMLTSDLRGAAFSVYINSQPPSQDAAELLETSLKNPAYKSARDMDKGESGPFKFAYFSVEFTVPGANNIQTHIQASTFIAGHWFDVHISKTSREKVDKQVLLGVLDSLVLRQVP